MRVHLFCVYATFYNAPRKGRFQKALSERVTSFPTHAGFGSRLNCHERAGRHSGRRRLLQRCSRVCNGKNNSNISVRVMADRRRGNSSAETSRQSSAVVGSSRLQSCERYDRNGEDVTVAAIRVISVEENGNWEHCRKRHRDRNTIKLTTEIVKSQTSQLTLMSTLSAVRCCNLINRCKTEQFVQNCILYYMVVQKKLIPSFIFVIISVIQHRF